MTRRPTFSELAWPNEPDDNTLALQWAQASALRILDWTWRAFDALASAHFDNVDLTQPLEQVERDLVRHHFIEIQILFSRDTDGFSSLIPHHEWPEMETRTSASAKPPAYDLAFISLTKQRWAWPIEAKVISTPSRLAEYLKDVNEKYITGVASPQIGEGAMIAYLLSGDGEEFIENLTAKLTQKLGHVSEFTERIHRTSEHSRSNAPDLLLHHMVMNCLQKA